MHGVCLFKKTLWSLKHTAKTPTAAGAQHEWTIASHGGGRKQTPKLNCYGGVSVIHCVISILFHFFLPRQVERWRHISLSLSHLSRSSHPPHLAYIHPTSKCDCCGWDKLISTRNMRRYEFTSDSRIRSLVSRGWESLCTSVSIGLWFRRLWCDSETVLSFISMHSNVWFLSWFIFFKVCYF